MLIAYLRRKGLCFGGLSVCLSVFLFVSPPENDSFRKDLCFSPDVYFFATRDLRDAWADRREILHDGQY